MSIVCINNDDKSIRHTHMSWFTVSGLCCACNKELENLPQVKEARKKNSPWCPEIKRDYVLQKKNEVKKR